MAAATAGQSVTQLANVRLTPVPSGHSMHRGRHNCWWAFRPWASRRLIALAELCPQALVAPALRQSDTLRVQRRYLRVRLSLLVHDDIVERDALRPGARRAGLRSLLHVVRGRRHLEREEGVPVRRASTSPTPLQPRRHDDPIHWCPVVSDTCTKTRRPRNLRGRPA
jgi:hypothetical protein